MPKTSQPSLFAGSDAYGQAIPSPTIAQAKEAGKVGIDESAAHAESDAPGFSARAKEFVLRYLRQHGETSGETLTDKAIEAGIAPDNLRAFGGVYQGLLRKNLIVKVGTCKRRKGHNCAGGSVYGIKQEPS